MRIRRSLQSKPYPSVPRINWSHPLARGLVLYCYDTGRNNVIDLVSGRGMTSQGTVSPANASAYGYGNKYPDNVSNTGVKLTSSASVEAVALPFSFASGFLQTGNNTQAFPTIFARAANNGATDPFHNCEIQATDTANQVRIAWNNSGTEQTTSPYALTYNKYHTAIGVLSSGAYAFWLDGAQKESGATTWVNSNTNDEVRFANNTGAGGAFPGFVYWGGVWNRALSAAEILRLYTDPYSFLIYPEEMFSRVATSSGAVNVSLTGVNATAAAGTPTVTGIGNVTLTGVNATAAAGTATVSAAANFTLTGVSATTAVNVPTITAAANVTPTGVVGTTAVNIPTVTGFANVTLSGVNATGQVGTLTVSTGGAVNVTLTGVNATAAAGSLTVTGFANVTLTGITATAQIGTLTTSAAANASVTGVAATSAVNTPTVTGLANVTLSGVLATVAAGNITVSVPTAVSVNITGVSASASAGTVTTNLDAAAGVTFGGGISYSQREFDRIIRLDYEEWKRKHKKNKKLDKAVEEAIEVLEEVAVRGLLDDFAPAIELKETIEALPTEPKAIAAVIEDIREQTRVLERMLDEDEDDIMLMIWALD